MQQMGWAEGLESRLRCPLRLVPVENPSLGWLCCPSRSISNPPLLLQPAFLYKRPQLLPGTLSYSEGSHYF